MSRKRLPVWRTLLIMAADLVAIGAGCCLAYWLRFVSPLQQYIPINNGFLPQDYLQLLPTIWIIWFIALRFENLYRRRSRVFDFNVVKRIVSGSFLAMLILIAFNFYRGPNAPNYSRLASVFLMGTLVASLIANRIVLHFIFRWMMLHHGVGQARTAILGGGRWPNKSITACAAIPSTACCPSASSSATPSPRRYARRPRSPCWGASMNWSTS